ncbi:MAG TPA: HAMP domain-containing sensor histidine kinase [Actinomycetota bacterium]|nr:HAMP domain-containing sensor histidine kinase [Actinomycetota bacterium]
MAIGSTLRRHWLEVGWALFATANVVVLFLLTRWETIPFHFIWVSLTIVYGLRVWSVRSTITVLSVTMLVSGAALLRSVTHGDHGPDELAEVPLMAAMFVAMVWHATRRQAATEEVRRLAETEHRMLERHQEFIRDASHELRTPITVARGHAELIRAVSEGTQAADDAEVVLDELGRLARISERLLMLASAEHPDFLHREPVDVEEFVEESGRRWSVTVPRRWEVRVEAPGIVDADRERIRFALDALVENAVKFTAEGETVAIVGRADDGHVILEVSDEGMGIPVDQQDRIFERFARGDDGRTRGSGGTGLGLAIVKAIAEAHGGSASVQSTPGKGTTFWMRIPGFVAGYTDGVDRIRAQEVGVGEPGDAGPAQPLA